MGVRERRGGGAGSVRAAGAALPGAFYGGKLRGAPRVGDAAARCSLLRLLLASRVQGKSVVDDYRTSEGTFLERGEDDVIAGGACG